VDHACGVDGHQALGQPGRQRQHLIGRQRSVAVYLLGQRRTRDIGSGQPRRRAVQVRFDHQRGKRAAHLPGRGGIVPETGPELVILGQFGADEFHRDKLPVR
jgi:hypothetical protein